VEEERTGRGQDAPGRRKGSLSLTDSREAPSYANYLAFVSSYLLVYVDAVSAIYTKVNKYERAQNVQSVRAMSVCYQ